ncbi:MAG: hypothetical protein O3A61_00025 [Actinomycetota bacterium]|nr:hypothetical protein [Actinomycetota bacterium]
MWIIDTIDDIGDVRCADGNGCRRLLDELSGDRVRSGNDRSPRALPSLRSLRGVARSSPAGGAAAVREIVHVLRRSCPMSWWRDGWQPPLIA